MSTSSSLQPDPPSPIALGPLLDQLAGAQQSLWRASEQINTRLRPLRQIASRESDVAFELIVPHAPSLNPAAPNEVRLDVTYTEHETGGAPEEVAYESLTFPAHAATTPDTLAAAVALDLLLQTPLGLQSHDELVAKLRQVLEVYMRHRSLADSGYDEAAMRVLSTIPYTQWPSLTRQQQRELLVRPSLDPALRAQVALLAAAPAPRPRRSARR